MDWIILYRRQSSANSRTLDVTQSGRSFMWTRNRMGPNDDVPPSKFEDEHDLRLNLRLSLRALGFCLLDPIVLI